MSVTEVGLRVAARVYSLDILKRITTGQAGSGHFATFELSGKINDVLKAWEVVQCHATKDQLRGRFVYLRSSDIDSSPYIGAESIWCQPETPELVGGAGI